MDKIIKKDIVNGVEYKYNGIGGGGSITDNNVIYISQADYDNLTPAEKADATKNYVIIGEGGIPVPTEMDAEDVNFDNTGTGMQSDNVQDAIEEVFQSVSNGKELIADAITDKGVSTSATDSFATMASNIATLPSSSQYQQNQLFIPVTITSQTNYSYLSVNNFGDVYAPDNLAYYKFAFITTSQDAGAANQKNFLCRKKTAMTDPELQISPQTISLYSNAYANFRLKIDGNNIIASFLTRTLGSGNNYNYYCMNYNSSTGFSNATYIGQFTFDGYDEAWTTACGITAQESLPALNVATLSTSGTSIVATLDI